MHHQAQLLVEGRQRGAGLGVAHILWTERDTGVTGPGGRVAEGGVGEVREG